MECTCKILQATLFSGRNRGKMKGLEQLKKTMLEIGTLVNKLVAGKEVEVKLK